MAKKKSTPKQTVRKKVQECCRPGVQKAGCGGCAYFLGFIGAAVYYISTATGFWNGVWGFIKALLWPAFLVYQVLKFMGQ